MNATVRLLHAGQPELAGDAAKSIFLPLVAIGKPTPHLASIDTLSLSLYLLLFVKYSVSKFLGFDLDF